MDEGVLRLQGAGGLGAMLEVVSGGGGGGVFGSVVEGEGGFEVPDWFSGGRGQMRDSVGWKCVFVRE